MRSPRVHPSVGVIGLVGASALGLGCDRRDDWVRADPTTLKASASSSTKASATPTPTASSSAGPTTATDEDDSEPKLVAFLTFLPPALPGSSPAKGPFATSHAGKGFDPLKAKPDRTWSFPDGSEVREFEQWGASDFQAFLAVVRGGKLVWAYDTVLGYAVEPRHGRIALDHVRADPGGKRVAAREIIDVAAATVSPLPITSCTNGLSWADGGARLVGDGFEFDAPFVPHAYICVFDGVGKLLARVDAGVHPHHAASIDFINMASGLLPKDPEVIWATREYEPYGNYDLTLIDTRPPHARKVARLPTPLQLGSPTNLEIDLASTTMSSTDVRYRGKDTAGTWGKWQTATFVDAP